MSKEKINQEFGMQIIDEIKKYLVEEMNLNELMSKNPKKSLYDSNFSENKIALASMVTGSISTSAFASLFHIPIGITSSAIGLKISAINAEIKKYKSIIKKKEEI